MKASLRFRDDQRPLLRAKVPVSVLGLPFLSGVAAGEARELRLDLATAFESGPSLRLSYRPNDPWSPFSLVVKTGVGAFGSPAASPLTMCAEFNLVGRGRPGFSIHLKPRLGDFCIKKIACSTAGSAPLLLGGVSEGAGHDTDGEGSADGADSPGEGFCHGNGALFAGKKPNGISTGIRSATAGGIRGLFSAAELSARSLLPLRGGTAVKFRWGMRIPSELRSGFGNDIGSKDPIGGISLRKLPILVMSKISIEHVAGEGKRQERASPSPAPAPTPTPTPAGDIVEACFAVQRQLAALQAENSTLRMAVEDLRADIRARAPDPVTPGALTSRSARPEVRDRKAWESNRTAAKTGEPAKNGSNSGKRSNGNAPEAGGKPNKEDVNEELRKALMGDTGAGV